MKTDGLFTVHRHEISFRNVPYRFRLVFFGDVHRDSPTHSDEHWQRFLAEARTWKDAYFIGMGDYVDANSTSERNCFGSMAASLHETTLNDLENLAAEKVKLLAKELSFMKGRLVGLLNGNHYFSFKDGTNTDMRLCQSLDCKYLGVSSFIRIYVEAGKGRRVAVDVFLHHGAGNGRLPGGSINRVDQMREYAEADIYAMGHDHKRGVFLATPRLYLHHNPNLRGGGLAVKERPQILVRSGSFLKSYEAGRRTYIVDSARGPCNLGHCEVVVSVDRDRDAEGGRLNLRLQGVA